MSRIASIRSNARARAADRNHRKVRRLMALVAEDVAATDGLMASKLYRYDS